MKLNTVFVFLSAWCVAALPSSGSSSEKVSTITRTVIKTHTKTIHTETLVPTLSGWLPAKSTKNEHPDAKAVQRVVKRPEALGKAIVKNPESGSSTKSTTTSSSKPPTTTITQWASTTATVTHTYSAYAACKSTSNYVHNGIADGTSGVDGTCDCEAYVETIAVAARSATECCHICWQNPTCIGSAYNANDPYGQGCLYYMATQCGNHQTYNYVEYLNGTKYGSNQTMSNGPCGACVYVDA